MCSTKEEEKIITGDTAKLLLKVLSNTQSKQKHRGRLSFGFVVFGFVGLVWLGFFWFCFFLLSSGVFQ